MEKEMIISIVGSQRFMGVPEERIELVTAGKYDQTEDGWKITYQESEATGLGDTLTTFDVGEDKIVLTRSGKINSRMIFQKGKRHLSVYETEYGALTIGVGVNKIINTLGEHGGILEVRYSIDIDQKVSGMNAFRIRVQEPGRGRLRS